MLGVLSKTPQPARSAIASHPPYLRPLHALHFQSAFALQPMERRKTDATVGPFPVALRPKPTTPWTDERCLQHHSHPHPGNITSRTSKMCRPHDEVDVATRYIFVLRCSVLVHITIFYSVPPYFLSCFVKCRSRLKEGSTNTGLESRAWHYDSKFKLCHNPLSPADIILASNVGISYYGSRTYPASYYHREKSRKRALLRRSTAVFSQAEQWRSYAVPMEKCCRLDQVYKTNTPTLLSESASDYYTHGHLNYRTTVAERHRRPACSPRRHAPVSVAGPRFHATRPHRGHQNL